ncbi:hypothetical protein BG004_003682 [Podila humilis]|nr:hypothetical protein BG004_003682 [Podila humilis]
MKPHSLQALYTRPEYNNVMSTLSRSSSQRFSRRTANGIDSTKNNNSDAPPPHKPGFPRPSIFQEAYLYGILHRPRDVVFLFKVVLAVVWFLFRLHFIELPYLILTLFRKPTLQKPVAWGWFTSVVFSILRAIAAQIKTMGQVRFVDHILTLVMSFMAMFERKVKITRNVRFEVNLDALLRAEGKSLETVRATMKAKGCSTDAMNPSQEYFESFHPPPRAGGNSVLANLPDEIGSLHGSENRNYVLNGEWIETLDEPKDGRPRSSTVLLYFHGGGHVFASTGTHTQFLARLAKELGPGARIFSVNYRLAPENPFPAAIHDAYAAYLYLTDPEHAALTLGEESAAHELAVDPRDIVVGGDSAGGNIAAGLMSYLTLYVKCPILPHASLLLSPWTDITSSLPSAHSKEWFCYCPGPIGTSCTDKSAYVSFKKANFASLYLVGDPDLMLNARNALGTERQWEWYSHLAQHPLVSMCHSNFGALRGLTDVLVQTASHDRLLDDSRLYAHRHGSENPDHLTRIEIYKNMVHVHQSLTWIFLSARIATKNLARFVERSRYIRDAKERELAVAAAAEQAKTAADKKTKVDSESKMSYAHVLQRVSKRDKAEEESTAVDMRATNPTLLPTFMQTNMVTEKSAADNVEWVLVEQNGKEMPGDEGWPMQVLIETWSVHHRREMEE